MINCIKARQVNLDDYLKLNLAFTIPTLAWKFIKNLAGIAKLVVIIGNLDKLATS